MQPFRLDAGSIGKPTSFEISFLLDGVRHQYSFAMTAERIVREALLVYRSTKPTQVFNRVCAQGEQDLYEFSSYLSGPRKLWQESTRPNALFLSTAALLNSEILGPVFQWIVRGFVTLPAGSTFSPEATTGLLATAQGQASVRDFLAGADISIANVRAVPHKGITARWSLGAAGAHASQEEHEVLLPVFEHVTSKGKATFDLHDESGGTQRLFGLIAPVLDCLRDGKVLVVDELDSSLHTLLVRRVVGMFHDPAVNTRGAQLIFTTHDTSLLDLHLFRRDQVWFTEKDADQATRVYPLTDFSPRKHEALERGYLSGRYGAVPFLPASSVAS